MRRIPFVFASSLVLWFLCLPVRLGRHTLPGLLERLGSRGPRDSAAPLRSVDEAIRTALRVCHFRLFRPPFFPRACLRQGLTLFHVLRQMGLPARIHFGVDQARPDFEAHCWVTLDGKAVAEPDDPGSLRVVYSYPTLQATGSETGSAPVHEGQPA